MKLTLISGGLQMHKVLHFAIFCLTFYYWDIIRQKHIKNLIERKLGKIGYLIITYTNFLRARLKWSKSWLEIFINAFVALVFMFCCISLDISLNTKGQLISKGLFGILNSSKYERKIQPNYYDTSGRLFFIRFLEEIEDTKKTFRN